MLFWTIEITKFKITGHKSDAFKTITLSKIDYQIKNIFTGTIVNEAYDLEIFATNADSEYSTWRQLENGLEIGKGYFLVERASALLRKHYQAAMTRLIFDKKTSQLSKPIK